MVVMDGGYVDDKYSAHFGALLLGTMGLEKIPLRHSVYHDLFSNIRHFIGQATFQNAM
jgi:hypothetical protein